jgi:hypothetical protein
VGDQLVAPERREQQAHTARDVEPDTAGRHDATRVDVGRRHTADREPVAPVHVGHGERGDDDPGERGDIHRLVQRPVAGDVGQQLLGREHDPRDAHRAVPLDPPPPR